ncbi:hypothetical protein HYW73_02225 [Candidatus Nomurabacteria bacterium]|nr:hypothetical protein [Candidatus Nomurabacteria bacterium]
MDKNVKIFIGVVAVLVIAIAVAAVARKGGGISDGPGKYDEFAACLKDKGAVFYGAFWCPHCQTQKKLFGSSQKLLPYVECSTADGRGQTQGCIEKEVKSYPTWEFADGSRLSGEIPLAQLAEKTSCALPQ